MVLTYIHPLTHLHVVDVNIIKKHMSCVVIAITHHITTEGAFALSAGGFHQIQMVALKGDICLPYLGMEVATIDKYRRKYVPEYNLIHFLIYLLFYLQNDGLQTRHEC